MTKREKAFKLIADQPNIQAAEIAEKVDCTSTYANALLREKGKPTFFDSRKAEHIKKLEAADCKNKTPAELCEATGISTNTILSYADSGDIQCQSRQFRMSELKNRIRNLVREGKSDQDIAEVLGKSISSIKRLRAKAGVYRDNFHRRIRRYACYLCQKTGSADAYVLEQKDLFPQFFHHKDTGNYSLEWCCKDCQTADIDISAKQWFASRMRIGRPYSMAFPVKPPEELIADLESADG